MFNLATDALAGIRQVMGEERPEHRMQLLGFNWEKSEPKIGARILRGGLIQVVRRESSAEIPSREKYEQSL